MREKHLYVRTFFMTPPNKTVFNNNSMCKSSNIILVWYLVHYRKTLASLPDYAIFFLEP